jgi:hypothetical protein
MTQSRTRRWSSDAHGKPADPGVAGLWGGPADEEPEVSGDPEGRARPSRALDPATSQALESLQAFILPPPPPPVSSRTLSGFAPRGSVPESRASEPPGPSFSPASGRTIAGVRGEAPIAGAPQGEVRADHQTADEAEGVALRPGAPAATPSRAMPATRRSPNWSARLGWSVAAALMALGVAFHALVYAPLLAEVSSLAQSSTAQLKERDAALAKLRAELAARQSRGEPLAHSSDSAPAAAVREPNVAAVNSRPAAPAQRAREQRVSAPATTNTTNTTDTTDTKHVAVAKPVDAQAERSAREPREPREPREHAAPDADSKGGVDRAAAAAATAALEAQAYTSPPPAAKPAGDRVEPAARQAAPIEAKPAHPAAAPDSPSAPEAKDSLSGMDRGSSDDPLEGL